MSFYLTPAKSTTKKPTRTLTQDKPTDWICIVCNNLNFSFRKKCNRCKTQTRTQNENQLATAYSQYYYQNQKYLTAGKQPLGDLTNCYTSQSKQLKYLQQDIEQLNFGEHEYSSINKVPQFQNEQNILDFQCWQSINAQQKQQCIHEERKNDEEISVCEFTDIQLECLVSKILDSDQ